MQRRCPARRRLHRRQRSGGRFRRALGRTPGADRDLKAPLVTSTWARFPSEECSRRTTEEPSQKLGRPYRQVALEIGTTLRWSVFDPLARELSRPSKPTKLFDPPRETGVFVISDETGIGPVGLRFEDDVESVS